MPFRAGIIGHFLLTRYCVELLVALDLLPARWRSSRANLFSVGTDMAPLARPFTSLSIADVVRDLHADESPVARWGLRGRSRVRVPLVVLPCTIGGTRVYHLWYEPGT